MESRKPITGRERWSFSKYISLLQKDLSSTYSRDLYRWLIISPIVGVITGLVTSGVAIAILNVTWDFLRPRYYEHHWLIVPGVVTGFLATGLIMSYLTDNPNLHSTDEVIRSYHEHMGDIDPHPFWYKLLATLTTVGFGGSAALEGPGIYAGGAIGSWLWTRLRRFGLGEDDRRVMLISGAAAGMASVFHAPLTGLIFALEMPFRDDLAHEALMPSLIAAVVSYATMASMLGSQALFGFVGSHSFAPMDLVYAALLGIVCGVVAMIFALSFRRFRLFSIRASIPHPLKLVLGGFATGLCGLAFVSLFDVPLMPLGANYEVVKDILATPHTSTCLLVFFVLKSLATLFSLGVGGVSAMFVPLLLMGGAIGSVFGQSVVHAPTVDLYAAIGMASFIAAAYKTPLAAVLFVAETTGGISFLIPTLIGAAVAYAASGDASVSIDQRLHAIARLSGPTGIRAHEIMRSHVVGIDAESNLREFFERVGHAERHAVYPVFKEHEAVGVVSLWEISRVPVEEWDRTKIGQIARREVAQVDLETDLGEVVRLLTQERRDRLVLVKGLDESPVGIITNSDVLYALETYGHPPREEESS